MRHLSRLDDAFEADLAAEWDARLRAGQDRPGSGLVAPMATPRDGRGRGVAPVRTDGTAATLVRGV
jgi:hypothetical protein